MIEFDVKKYNDDEIKEMISMLVEEQQERRDLREAKAWENVEKAIMNYINEFGEITFSDYNASVSISSKADFSSWGTISDATCGW